MSSRRNKYDTKDSLKMGDRAEDKFVEIASRKGWKVSTSIKDSDIHEHWDFLIRKGEKAFKVDVKARKRISRNEANQQDEWIWLELHGVREKDSGWLYGGLADLLAFETSESFVIVRRTDVIDLVDKLVDTKEQVPRPEEARYKVYSRSGRPDKITLIQLEKLRGLLNREWRK